MNSLFLNSPFGRRRLTLDLTTNSTTTPVTSEFLEDASHLSRGLYAISAAIPCAMRIFRFSRLCFFQPLPVQVVYYFYRRVLLLLSFLCNDSNTVPTHALAATLLYANQELTYTPCLAYSAARTLRAGGETRNALLQRRFRSAISCSPFRVGPDVAPGVKCKYNCARISCLYLASDLRTTPPPRMAHHCDPLRLRIFSPRRLRSLQP